MTFSLTSAFVSILIGGLALLSGAAQAQDTDPARKKCVAYGFRENTPAHERCVKQVLQSAGSSNTPAKPVPATGPGSLDAQKEDEFWKDAKAVGNRAAFEAYLDNYPKGRYAGLARANMERFADSPTAQPKDLAEQKVAGAGTAKLESANPRPGQIIKDCADCPKMMMIPARSFQMGSTEFKDEEPLHRVTLPAFLLGLTEVTQGQWLAVMGSNPSHFKACGADCPVENISWYDAQEYARKLSAKTGKAYRLPSESEWEYAARAGNSGKWSFGDDESQLSDYAWFNANSGNKTQPVALKRPNAFGLYDMHGNVWEWVQDVYHENYQGAPADGSAWISGGDQAGRVLRGGAWGDHPLFLRSAIRNYFAPDSRYYFTGLRIARSL
jgi:formylglycine-generating enzyme required for sulfatase activity